ncbi:MAG: ATP-dependent DNA helicase [Bradymonadaceae bacterium]
MKAMTMEGILGPGGLLSQKLDHYEFRAPQVRMAEQVQKALAKRRPLVVEAATGTGKTLAYLIPALLSGKRIVVSTGTKALQEQLFFKDIPFLAEHLPDPFKAVLLKGRKNYLCQWRYSQMKAQPVFRSREDMELWPTIKRWVDETVTGDRAEVEGMPDDFATWNELSVGAENCLGQRCEYYDQCFVNKARFQAQEADLIVVNHHLFFADLALRDQGFGEILPEYDAVIFDEAHHLEDVATEYFGVNVSNFRFTELAGDIDRALETAELKDTSTIDTALAGLVSTAQEFFTVMAKGLGDGRHPKQAFLEGERGERLQSYQKMVSKSLDGVRRALKLAGGLGEVGERLLGRCKELDKDLSRVMNANDPQYAYFADLRNRNVFLQAAPINLARLLRDKLLETHDTLVFTSATLATGGNLEFFKNRIGMGTIKREGGDYPPLDVDESVLPAIFEYGRQCVLYVPRKLPPPNDPSFAKNVALIVEYLVGITEGRAFVLFTSYTNLNAVHELLVDKLEYPVLKQGERSKRELLDLFRETEGAVLFATSSFWEGVDISGDALSLVIIDKLPFANPSDPVMKARLDLVEADGGNSFFDISLPSAALTLKQGFGRLIRSSSDKGIVAILDSRIAHKRYGRYFLQSLPPAPVVWTAPEVKRWWHTRIMVKDEV